MVAAMRPRRWDPGRRKEAVHHPASSITVVAHAVAEVVWRLHLQAAGFRPPVGDGPADAPPAGRGQPCGIAFQPALRKTVQTLQMRFRPWW